MYLYKADLKKGFRANRNIILWRRDDFLLLEKYKRIQDSNEFRSTSNYTKWKEEYDFLDDFVEVNCIEVEFGNLGKVQILSTQVDEIEEACLKESSPQK